MKKFLGRKGRVHDWDDLIPVARSILQRRYNLGADREWLEDALHDSWIHIYEQWQFRPSAQLGEFLNWSNAVAEMVTYTRRLLRKYAQAHAGERHGGADQLRQDIFDDPTLDTIVHDEEDAAMYGFLSSLTPEELAAWFDNLEGTEREQASRQGVSQPTAHRRRAATKAAIRSRWLEYAP